MRHADLNALTPQLIALARTAGRSIIEIYDRYAHQAQATFDALIKQKADQSPLTHADLASHRLICEGLRYLTPSIPIVSEEDTNRPSCRITGAQFWLVDPLDGTKEFLARSGEFTVNIALVRNGAPVWGVVFAPLLDQLYWGGPGIGASRQSGNDEEPIHVARAVANGNRIRIVASKSHLNRETSDFIAQLGDIELIQAGSSLKFCRVAEGLADLYPRLAPTCEWDTAAAQAVVEGAGGFVTDLNGVPLRYGKHDVINPSFVASSVPLATLRL